MYQTTPTQPHSLQSPCTKSRQGFALILSLGLMAFVLLLLMSITTLVRVETVSATQAKDMLEARANAQLGLMLAIGELQEHAGSDRRVTAQSGIISDTVEQAHILGVWNSWGEGLEDGDDVTEADVANTYVAGREPRFLTWLIPGADALNFQYPNSVATNNSVELVGLGSLGPTPDPKSRVRMPLVEITKQNTTAGHYSWWISGENSKARVNLYKEEPETGDFAAKSAQLVAAPTLSVKALSGLETIVTDDSARRITTQNSLGFLGQSGAPLTDAIKARFHDITVDSVGLLTNTKSAGMRKDLNLLMELETLPPDYAGEEIFAGGPGWDDLRRYYRNYKLPTEGGLIKWVNGIPHFFAGDTWLEYVGHKRWQRHLPIPIKWQWLLSHYSVPANEATHGTGMYEVRMVFDNIMEMWNPYTIPMEVPSDSHIDFKLWNIPYGVSYYKDGIRWNRSIPKKALFWVVQDMPRVGAWQMHNALIRFDEPLMPGEVQVYSDHSGSPQEISYAIELNSGWEFGGGLYADTLGHGGVKLIVSGSTEIEATLEEDGSAPAWAGFDHFTDIYFVGPSGYPSQYGILKNILTRDSLATVTDDLPQLNEPTFTASQIQGVANKKPFAIVGMRARTEQRIEPSSESPISKSEQARTKHFLFNDPWQNTTSVMNNNETTLRHGGYEFFVQRVNSLNDYPFVEISADDKGYLGTSRGAREPFNGQNHVPIREIPFQPLLSLAQLQHAGLGEPAPDPSFEVPLNNPDAGVPYISYPYVANAFGNSWALPFIKGTMIEQSAIAPDSGTMRLLHDKAWKSNSALWDDWCFSSVSPQNNELVPPADQRTISEVLTEALTGEKSLPNSRYRIVNVLQDAEAITTAADLLASSGEGYRKLTSLLVCECQFDLSGSMERISGQPRRTLDCLACVWKRPHTSPRSQRFDIQQCSSGVSSQSLHDAECG